MTSSYIDLYWLHIWDQNTPIDETMAALNDLVRAGKVRYIGVSDTPAWKIAQANTFAHFRDWSPFIALQIEYSLLERTVEQERVPVALEFGLGVTPWSPFKSGALSGKYTRANGGRVNGGRGALVEGSLNETTFSLIDQLEDNLKASDVKLTADDIATIDKLTQPKLDFPQTMLPMAPSILNGGVSVNGTSAPPSGFTLQKGDTPY